MKPAGATLQGALLTALAAACTFLQADEGCLPPCPLLQPQSGNAQPIPKQPAIPAHLLAIRHIGHVPALLAPTIVCIAAGQDQP